MAILEGPWETDDILRNIIDSAHRPTDRIFFESDPKAIVERLIAMVQKDREELRNLVYNNHDGWSGTGKGDEVIF
jgi:hypothetical protein